MFVNLKNRLPTNPQVKEDKMEIRKYSQITVKIARVEVMGRSHLSSCLLGRLKSRGSQFKASLDKWFLRPHLQNNQSKMDWRSGSSGRGRALQV
jgi:hypothetical protein